MLYALMSFEQFAEKRRFIKKHIKFSKCETEFYTEVVHEEDFEDCVLLDREELQEHLKASPVRNPDAQVEEDISKLKKSELLAMAEELGIDLPAKTTKAQLIALIEES